MVAHIAHHWQVDTGTQTVLAESNSHSAPPPDADPVEVARSATCDYLLTQFPMCKSSADATVMAQNETKASRLNLTNVDPAPFIPNTYACYESRVAFHSMRHLVFHFCGSFC